jgi:hypothetical protein
MFVEPNEPANPEEVKEVTVKSREEIEDLKSRWIKSRCEWDLANSVGFQAHTEELRIFQEFYLAQVDEEIEAARQARYEEIQHFSKLCGLSRLQETTLKLAAACIPNGYYPSQQEFESVIDRSIDAALYLLRQTSLAKNLPLKSDPPQPQTQAEPNPATVKIDGNYTAVVLEPINGLVQLERSGRGAYLPYTELEGLQKGQRILVSILAFTANGLIMASRETAMEKFKVQLGEEPEGRESENEDE